MLFLWWLSAVVWFMIWKQRQSYMIVCKTPVPTTKVPSAAAEEEEREPSWMKNAIDENMNGATITMKVGEKRNVILSGNATTGYAWRIVSMDGGSVKTEHKWKYHVQYPYLTGSGGYFQWEFNAVELGKTDVYFIYDAVADPQMGYYYYLKFNVVG